MAKRATRLRFVTQVPTVNQQSQTTIELTRKNGIRDFLHSLSTTRCLLDFFRTCEWNLPERILSLETINIQQFILFYVRLS